MRKKTEDRELSIPVLKISVRNLVEFILRTGDIDNRYSGAPKDAMAEGSKIHRKIQREMGHLYHPEVALKHEITFDNYVLVIEGRADGIIDIDENDSLELYTIDEIKGVYQNLDFIDEPVSVHLAQAKCYAYIYSLQKGLDSIRIQMTYANLDSDDIKRFKSVYSFIELEEWYKKLIGEYKKWADFSFEWAITMRESIGKINFPYDYRPGQKELASDVYRTILRSKDLFLQAPTGVGKTLSTVFPSVKAVGEGLADRIFYLTAKTMTATVASKTIDLFMEQGYRAKTIQITAKEKMCNCDEMQCDPVHCEYAKGHFDRVNDAVFEILQNYDKFMREDIREFAREKKVCPFELSLDISSWCDNIICDYNYAFDPNVYLKRFFAEGNKGKYIFLVDEAHNLVDRGRGMYSAVIVKESFLAMGKIVRGHNKRLEDAIMRCNKIMLEYKRKCEDMQIIDFDIDRLIFSMMRLAELLDKFLQKSSNTFSHKEELTQFYFDIRYFLSTYDMVDEHYVIYTEHSESGEFVLHLQCVDPSHNLEQCLAKARSTIFFSATLLPINYYKSLLSEKKDNYAIYAKSPFDGNQKLLLIGRDVSSKYTRRTQDEYQKMAEYIYQMVDGKEGNYMVFAPSYAMMNTVKEELVQLAVKLDDRRIEDGSWRILTQSSGMSEAEREEFLYEFEKTGTLIAFCVMGGIFSEGIDLTEEKLIGAAIIGTGLPQVGHEQEIIKGYFDEKADVGFDYAYRYPGMNKVLQAAGRVIRTVNDRGVIMLLDERFLQAAYKALFPREWDNYRICQAKDVRGLVEDFWSKNVEKH